MSATGEHPSRHGGRAAGTGASVSDHRGVSERRALLSDTASARSERTLTGVSRRPELGGVR